MGKIKIFNWEKNRDHKISSIVAAETEYTYGSLRALDGYLIRDFCVQSEVLSATYGQFMFYNS